MLWYGDFRSTARPAFSCDAGQWAGSQLSVLARCRLEAACSYAIDVLTVTFVTAPSHSLSLLLCLSPTLTSFLSLSPNLLFPLSNSLPHFIPVLPSQQPSTAVRAYHSSKTAAMSPSLGSSWTTGSTGGQGARSGPSFARGSLQHYLSHQQQHPHHHSLSTHTSYAYCPTHAAVSTADFFFLRVTRCLSASYSLCALISYSSIPPGTAASRSGCDLAAGASGQYLRFHQMHHSAFEKCPRCGSLLCSTENMLLVYFWQKLRQETQSRFSQAGSICQNFSK